MGSLLGFFLGGGGGGGRDCTGEQDWVQALKRVMGLGPFWPAQHATSFQHEVPPVLQLAEEQPPPPPEHKTILLIKGNIGMIL